ncbi:hypothetical protein G9C85_02895 [Halorubellus sp. JP-L1]|uniref:hypothetical protein n=1 Tax=Halorubellus sp. JP-L1 TaxID=2715753 RepID=UPI00140BD812|nr:hypothetical protein [Halorubellus sp. JP-L1]NHN40584.1 hypothetical protein [Halorubellus sp. JP-L1]
MTLVAVLADPPRPGLVLDSLVDDAPIDAKDAADLYEASLLDTIAASANSGAKTLVNYRSDDTLPDEHVTDTPAEAEVRALASQVVDFDGDDVRFEVQVGSTFDARVGNTVTHLLRDDPDVSSVLAVDGVAPLIGRGDVDSTSMKLRRSPVVLGPSDDGAVWGAAFGDLVDFEGAYTPPALETLTQRAVDAGHDVDYAPTYPRIDTPSGLRATVAQIRARQHADRIVPEHTAQIVDDLGLAVRDRGDGPEIVRE